MCQTLFDPEAVPAANFLFADPAGAYLTKLRSEFELDALVSVERDDLDRALALMHWAHERWEHDGANTPTRSDPLSILHEALSGKRFRCVEYAIVLAAALAALGYRSRILDLKTADVETREIGAGHVVVEVYLPDIKRWAMLDGEFDAVPMTGNQPLNAVQLAEALRSGNAPVTIGSRSPVLKADYLGWIKPYLHYFTVGIDNRFDVPRSKEFVRLAPLGSVEPKCFQGRSPLPPATIFTHCPSVIYPMFQ